MEWMLVYYGLNSFQNINSSVKPVLRNLMQNGINFCLQFTPMIIMKSDVHIAIIKDVLKNRIVIEDNYFSLIAV